MKAQLLSIRWLLLVPAFWACNTGLNRSSDSANVGPARSLDSAFVHEEFAHFNILRDYTTPLLAYYQNRKYAPAWFANEKNLLPHARQMLMQIDDAKRFGFRFSEAEMDTLHRLLDNFDSMGIGRAEVIDITLSSTFLRLADFLAHGYVQPNDANVLWEIPLRKVNLVEAMDRLLGSDAEKNPWGVLEPTREEYRHLKSYMDSLDEQEGGADAAFKVSLTSSLHPDDRSTLIPTFRRYFGLAQPEDSMLYDSVLLHAVKEFQVRHNLNPDGVIGEGTMAILEMSTEDKRQQLLATIQRFKWMPDALPANRLEVNLPHFWVTGYREHKPTFSCRTVVGAPKTPSPVFYDTMEYIVLSPFWYLPQSIITKEVMYLVKRDDRYLNDRGMEVYVDGGWRLPDSTIIAQMQGGKKFRIRQRPGKSNSLGSIKFLFPNHHQVYMHDTNSPSYFGKDRRDLSHGCIRVEKPLDLAEWLLGDDPYWTNRRLDSARKSGSSKSITLKEKLPVLIWYSTVWVHNSNVTFLRDIYGMDQMILDAIARKTNPAV